MIREYAAHDLSAIIDLIGRSVRELASRDYTSAQISAWWPERPDVGAWERRLATGTTFVAVREGRVVGVLRMETSEHIDLLFVHPAFARQGVARALHDRAMRWAIDAGASRLTAHVSITARPFFDRMGFRVVAPQTVERHGVHLRNFRMMLDLMARSGAESDSSA